MYQIAVETFQNGAKFAVTLDRTFRRRKFNGMKVGGQRTEFLDLRSRPDQKIFRFTIKPPQRSHHIANVSPDTEVGHAPDVDGNLHRWHLTIGTADQHRGFRQERRRAHAMDRPYSIELYPRTSACAFARRCA